MKNIPTLFERDEKGSLDPHKIHPNAQWVLSVDLSRATQMYDGIACLLKRGRFFKQFVRKRTGATPQGWIPAQNSAEDNQTWPGWSPVSPDPSDDYLREAMINSNPSQEGTYELCGPTINDNPEGLKAHQLIKHGDKRLPDFPRYKKPMGSTPRDIAIATKVFYDQIEEYLKTRNMEGVVFYHRDPTRMAKIKKKDFGLPRVPKAVLPKA